MRNIVIADLTVIPIGTGKTSIGELVAAAVNAIKLLENVDIEVTSMGTILASPELNQILKAVELTHEALVKKGVQRIETVLKIDDRRDKPRTAQQKVDRILEEIEKAV